MYRYLIEDLKTWQQQQEHLPLLIRGARQVGKSYLIKAFGKSQFAHYLEINFELQPEYKQCFDSLNPVDVINNLQLLSGQKITPGTTLLFLDEIQECPQAIMALRYFKEQCPALHVIGAGSLLEFALQDEHFRMPVGRVEFRYLYPLSFKEFLLAINEELLVSFIENYKLMQIINEAVHNKLLKLLRLYFLIGGMPAAINAYLQDKSNLLAVQNRLSQIILTYQNDFGKYGGRIKVELLQKLFQKIPMWVTQQIQYTKLLPETQIRDTKKALFGLEKAGLIKKVEASSCSGLPLASTVNEKKFKYLFLDNGLVNRALGLGHQVIQAENLLLLSQGAQAEQFVGQELQANQTDPLMQQLFFWARDKAGSQAEVDFALQVGSQIVPVEVKSGPVGKLRSLKLLIEEQKLPFGIKLSQALPSVTQNIYALPLYLAGELERLLN